MAQDKSTPTDATAKPEELLQSTWAGTVDSQTAQQYTGLAQIRRARVNQLQRQIAVLTNIYGADDAGVLALQASLRDQQAFAAKLSVVSDAASSAAPTAPANGWVLYGRVRHADLTPAPRLTVFLADPNRAWLKKYGYAFTDDTGFFTLTYAPAAPVGKKARSADAADSAVQIPALTVYVEVSNADCKLVYLDDTLQSIATGTVVYRDILLPAGALGNPPCEPGASASVPCPKK